MGLGRIDGSCDSFVVVVGSCDSFVTMFVYAVSHPNTDFQSLGINLPPVQETSFEKGNLGQLYSLGRLCFQVDEGGEFRQSPFLHLLTLKCLQPKIILNASVVHSGHLHCQWLSIICKINAQLPNRMYQAGQDLTSIPMVSFHRIPFLSSLPASLSFKNQLRVICGKTLPDLLRLGQVPSLSCTLRFSHPQL